MKKLFIVRHAKSDWNDYSLDDLDRPLNKRGAKNVPFIGNLLREKKVCPDIILSSPALRAKSTAKEIANILNCKNIIENEKIYESSFSSLLHILKTIDNKNNIAFLVGHNPSLNMLAEELCGFEKNIVTCGVVEIELDIDVWDDLSYTNSKFVSFEYPKKYE
jgi:phosphohistidine phosphatase